MEGIYKFTWDVGRLGMVEGTFVALAESVQKAIGASVNFGEILGKHSEIFGTIEEDEIVLLTDNPEAVTMFKEFGLDCGYNPLDYLQSTDEE